MDSTETEIAALRRLEAGSMARTALAAALRLDDELLDARLARLVNTGHLAATSDTYASTPAGAALLSTVQAEYDRLTANLRQLAQS